MTLRVLIVDAGQAQPERLQDALAEAGFTVLARVGADADLYGAMEDLRPDAVIVDAELPTRDTLEHLAQLGRRYPKPMIMLSGAADAELTAEAARAGVSAYVVEGLAPATVQSLVHVAIAHYQAQRALKTELNRTQQTLAQRRAIDRAKCLLMERLSVGEQAAYERLRKMAMDRRLSLHEVAVELVSARETPTSKPKERRGDHGS